MTELNLTELDRLEREMQGKVMSTNVSDIHEQLRPLLQLVDEMGKILWSGPHSSICKNDNPRWSGECLRCMALAKYRRAKGLS